MSDLQMDRCVLQYCRAVGGERFTLRQVVKRVASERPELMDALPTTWARLMEAHRVRVLSERLGGLYCVVRSVEAT